MYEKIYDFCKVRNLGTIFKNTDSPTPRVQFLLVLLEELGVEYELDKFPIKQPRYSPTGEETIFGYNIIMKGQSDKMVVAHHDIVNPSTDNANDNSASVINAISLKTLRPEINVVLLDGEEMGGLGSQRCSDLIKEGYFGSISWVLNLELTGRGGKHFFIGNYPGKLFDHIKSIFDCPVFKTPFNDSVIFRKNGIDSVVINPLPPIVGIPSIIEFSEGVTLDHSLLFNCHTPKDALETISTDDMKEFVEEILLNIV